MVDRKDIALAISVAMQTHQRGKPMQAVDAFLAELERCGLKIVPDQSKAERDISSKLAVCAIELLMSMKGKAPYPYLDAAEMERSESDIASYFFGSGLIAEVEGYFAFTPQGLGYLKELGIPIARDRE